MLRLTHCRVHSLVGLAALVAFAALSSMACDLHRDPGEPDAAVRLDGGPPDAGQPDAAARDAAAGDAAAGDAGGDPDSGSPCVRVPGPADGERRVVVSRPYDTAGGQASLWEVLTLSAAGELARPGVTFTMGRSTLGRVVFTPDGEVGLVAQEDGSLGVFTLDGQGVPQVVHAGLEGGFYASDVIMDPAGTGAWVLDGNWRENGGGIYRVSIACDGQVTDEGLLAAAKLPYGMALLGDGSGQAVLAGKDVLGSPADRDAHLITMGASPAWIDSAVAFSDDDDIIGSLAVTPDGSYALVGDNQGVFSTPNRVAVLELGTSSITPLQELTPIQDPVDLVASPFGDMVLVVSGLGDAFVVLDQVPSSPTAPFEVRASFTYQGASPQLPGKAALLERGALRGLVLVAELSGVRRVRFDGSGAVTDLGLFDLGSGLENIVGALGVQP